MINDFRSDRTFAPLHAEDIAIAMELRNAGESAFSIWLETGVTEANLNLAEVQGFDAYPLRPHDSNTMQ